MTGDLWSNMSEHTAKSQCGHQSVTCLIVFQLPPVQQPKPVITPRWIIPTTAVSHQPLCLPVCVYPQILVKCLHIQFCISSFKSVC